MMSGNTKGFVITPLLLILSVFFGFSAHAQTGKGMSAPPTTFGNNPFAGKAGVIDDDEEDDESDDISDDIIRSRMEQRIREQSQGIQAQRPGLSGGSASAHTPVDISETTSAIGATSLQGGPNSKITPAQQGPNCLALNPQTGYGPDIVSNFDFPDADIIEIAKTLGKLTCINFMFDKDVRGKISIVSNAPITIGDAWKAFLTALDTNGFSLIPSGKYFRIARQRDAKDKQIKTYTGATAPDNDMYITRVISLKYISAEEVSRVFRNFMPPNTRIIAYDQTNTLIVTDTGSNIKKITDMLAALDVETYDEKLEVIKIKFASAQEVAALIDKLLPGGGGGGGVGVPAAGGGIPRFRGGQGVVRRTKEGGVISNIIPDDRTNSVIVSANGKGLEQVNALIAKLDAKVTTANGGSKIQVIYLQYADAEQVAQTLNNLASGSSGGNNSGRPTSPIGGVGSPTTAQLFEGSIKISADKPTNSLVITGSPSDFQTVQQVIAKLDIPRDQVYVEAIIMEMTVDKNFELGTSVASPTNGIGFLPGNDFKNFLLDPFSVQGLVMGFRSKGRQSLTLPGSTTAIEVSSVMGLIKALQTNSNANILSTPQILTLDNQEAMIEVGETIPVPVVTNIQGGGTQTAPNQEKVSLSLTIKPQINKASNFVKLEINQKMEDISNRKPPVAVADTAFGKLTRASKTTVIVQDGDTVALGGLVRDKVLEQVTKVPLLGDIPLLGWLFRSKSSSTAKQNLISFITPRIIKQYQSIRKVVDSKIQERDDFIEKNMGGEDVFKDHKMKLIKGLPPVSELKDGSRVETGDAADVINTPEPISKEPANLQPLQSTNSQATAPSSPDAAQPVQPSPMLEGSTPALPAPEPLPPSPQG